MKASDTIYLEPDLNAYSNLSMHADDTHTIPYIRANLLREKLKWYRQELKEKCEYVDI